MAQYSDILEEINRRYENSELSFEKAIHMNDYLIESRFNDDIIDGPVFCSLEEFLDYYGLEESDTYEIITESSKNKMKNLNSKESLDRLVKIQYGVKKTGKQMFQSNSVSDKDFEMIKDAFQNMKEAKTFPEYKKYFQKIILFCNIPSNCSVIVKYSLTKGKKDKNTVKVQFSCNAHKIVIPENFGLYHKSPAIGMKNIWPTFKTKGSGGKGYLYSSPRVYFSLKKNMINLAADLSKKDGIHLYKATEKITSVYIDPLVDSYQFKAVYVETNHPIPCKEVTSEDISIKQESEDISMYDISRVISRITEEYESGKYTKEQAESLITFAKEKNEKRNNFVNTMIESGIIPLDDEYTVEGIDLHSIEKKIRDKIDTKYIKKQWDEIAKSFDDKWKKKEISDEKTKEKLKKAYEKLKQESISYGEYKSNFSYICKYIGIDPKNTVIRGVDIYTDDKTGKDMISVGYSHGKRAVIIPNGTELTHVSPAKDITELKPSFRSKVKGKYMYSSPRVYFTLAKVISSNKAGLEKTETTAYTPTENIKVAYVDPCCPEYKTGAVFVDTLTPIKIRKK